MRNNFYYSNASTKLNRWIICLFIVIGLWTSKSIAQCAYPASPVIACTSAAPTTVGASVSCAVGTSGNIFRVTGLQALGTYRFSNCGSGFDTQLTLYPQGGGTSVAYDDDNGIACTGAAASFDYTPTVSGNYDCILAIYNCATSGNPGTVTVTLQVAPPAPCVTPTDQSASLTLTPVSTTSISGSFTAAPSAPNGYLVVRYLTGATPTDPVDGVTYTAGGALGAGTVVSSGASLSFTATGLTATTTYDFYVYSMNNLCTGGPKYLTTVPPKSGTATTNSPAPPSCPTTFTPAAGAINVPTSQVLSWSGATGDPAITGYDVYFSTNSALVTASDPSVRVINNLLVTSYTPSPALSLATTYYFKVVPRNSLGAASGCAVNSFSTHFPTTINSTTLGGLWSSTATWVGGVVPAAGDNVVISDGSIVTVDQVVSGIGSLTIGQGTSGILQWNATANAMTLGGNGATGNVTINPGGNLNAFTTSQTGITINLSGDFINNGTANLAMSSATLNFNGSQITGGSLAQTLGGTGVFIGDGTNGIIRNLLFQTTGNSTISTSQNIIVPSSSGGTSGSVGLMVTAGTLNTNGKLIVDNTAQVFGQPFNQRVYEIVVTAMGSGYSTASPPSVTVAAPTGAGLTATASPNIDDVTGTLRSITITFAGDGYRSNPLVTISGGTGSGASATAVVVQSIAGAANSLVQKCGVANIIGGLTIKSDQAVGGITTANGGLGYTSAPTVGFTVPTGILNLVTSGGSGYTVAPTVAVSGGTNINAGTNPTFTVVVSQGQVVSVICSASGTALWTSPPTLTMSGGTFTTQATAAFPAGCLPTATASISNGQVSNFTITNGGFGYAAAPTVGLVGGGAGTVATAPTCRIGLYNLGYVYLAPATNSASVSVSEGAEIPSNRRINVFVMNNPAGATFTGNVELYSSAPLTLTSGRANFGSNTLLCSHPSYAGQAGSLTSNINGIITLSSPGGSVSRTFPLEAALGVATGTGSVTTGSTITRLTARYDVAPSGSVSPSGSATGTRSFRLQSNAGVYGTSPTVTLNWNANDMLFTDQASLFVAQAASPSGSWTTRSLTSGTGSLAATGSRTTATTSPGPIVPIGDDYFAWVKTSTTPALSYSIVRTTGNAYNSIMATGSNFAWSSTSNDDNTPPAVTIPSSTFQYQGQTITSFNVCTNGWVKLNSASSAATTSTSFSNNIGASGIGNLIAAFWDDLTTNPNSGGIATLNTNTKYQIIGSTPGSRQIVIEWSNYTVFGAAGPQLNFQVVLDETDNSITINYGLFQGFNGTNNHTYSYSVGLGGLFVNGFPLPGQLLAQQYENTADFSNAFAEVTSAGANGLRSIPECNSSIKFTPGVYAGFTPPVPTPPSNDEPAGALLIPAYPSFPSNLCGNFYTSRYATATTSVPACAGNNDDDVWFKFTAIEPATTVRVYGSGGYIARVQVLDASLNVLAPPACVVASAGGTQVDAILTGLTVGNLYYVRVYHDLGGIQATAIANVQSGGGAVTGFVMTNTGSGYNSTSTGSFLNARVTITGGGGTDAVGTANISSGTISSISLQNGGYGYTSAPQVTIEQPNWASIGQFALIVYAPAPNDECSTAITLTNLSNSGCNQGQNSYNNVSSASATASAQTSCSGTADDDVWYKFDAVNANTSIIVSGSSGFDAVFQVFDGGVSPGNCGTMTSILCQNSTGVGGTESAIVPTTVGNTYFVRVYHSGNGAGGPGETFNLCVSSAAPGCIIAPTSPANASSACGSGVVLQWPAATGATGYNVYLDAGAGPATTLVSSNQPGTSYAVSGTLAAGPYSWRVAPINTFGTNNTCSDWTFTVLPSPTVTVSPNPAIFCTGSSGVLLTASGADTYIWSPSTGLSASTGSSVTASPAATTTYTVTGNWSLNSCFTNASVTVNLVTSPTITSVTATPSGVCSGGSSTLTAVAIQASDVSTYSFAASTGTFTPLVGGTAVSAILTDDAVSGAIPIGFNFIYEGVAYNQLVASSNGALYLGASGNSTTAPTLASTTPRPFIAPLGDDMHGGSGAASYTVTGSPGSQVFTFEWLNWRWYYTAATPDISIQCKLYEADGKIEFIYQQESGSLTGSEGASIGLAGATSGKFLSLSDAGSSPTASSSTETTSINVRPATGQVYTFMPAISSLSYSWSPSTFLTSTSGSTVTATGVTATTTYTVSVSNGTCTSTGSTTVNTGNVAVAPSSTLITGAGNYCTPNVVDCSTFASFGNYLSQVSLNTMVNNTGHTSASTQCYTYYNPSTPSTTTTLTAGSTYTIGFQQAQSDANMVSAWIDYNNDGTFDAGEMIASGVSLGTTLNTTISSAPFTVPAGIANGTHRLRVILNFSTSPTDPCGISPTYTWADVEDYNITVTGGITAGAPCAGAQFQLHANNSGGGAPYTFAWSPATGLSATNIENPIATPLTSTTYTVTVSDNCGSSATSTVQVNVSPLPSVSVTTDPVNAAVCGSGSVNLTASGASTYTWSPSSSLNSSVGSTVAASPAVSTTYTVIGTDANGCSASATSLVHVSPAINMTASADPTSICTGASSQLQASATQQFPSAVNTYSFAASSGTFTPLVGGTAVSAILTDDAVSSAIPIGFNFVYEGVAYTQLVASSNGALYLGASGNSTTAPTLASTTPRPFIAPLGDDMHGGSGAASYLVTGSPGSRVFTFEWLNWRWYYTASTPDISIQCRLYEADGKIEFIYRQESGALTGSEAASIGLAGASTGVYLSLNNSSSSPSTSSTTETTTISSRPATGQVYAFTPPATAANYSYAWSPSTYLSSSSINNPVASNVLSSTTYTVTATDDFGCTGSATVALTAGAPLVASVGPDPTICAGLSTTLHVTASGGAPITYMWMPGGSTAADLTVSPASTTTYTVTVYDGCGSSTSLTNTVNVLPAPVVNVTPTSAALCGSGTVTLDASGTADTYVWNPTTGLDQSTGAEVHATPTVTTVYTVTGTFNSNGCTSTASTTVNFSPVFTVNALASPDAICPGASSTLTASVPAGTTASSYNFSASSGTFTPIAGSLGSTEVTAVEADDAATSTPIPFGFTFNFEGTPYTGAYMSSNGYLTLGASNSSLTNNLATGSGRPIIAPLWDDLDGSTSQTPNSRATYTTTGSPGSRICTFEWYKWQWYYSSDAEVISFQVKLYEGSNRIDFIYQQEANAGTPSSASIGLGGATSGVFLSLNNSSASPTASSTVETTTINARPATGQVYTFTPPAATGYTFLWSTSETTPSIIVTPPSNSTYTVTATDAFGCSATNTTSVSIINSDASFHANDIFGSAQDFTFDGAAFCVAGIPVQLVPTVPGGTFSGPGTIYDDGSLSWYFDPTGTVAVSPPAVIGANTVTYTQGCATHSETATVDSVPVVTLASFADVCQNDAPFILTGGSPAGGTYFVDNIAQTTFDPTLYSVGSHNIYYQFGTVCTGQSPTTTILVNPNPDAPVSGGDVTVCQSATPASISATAPAGSTVDWYSAATGGSLLLSNSSTYSSSTAGTYYAESRNTTTGCKSTTRTGVTLNVNANPAAPTGSDVGSCTNTLPATVSATAPGGSVVDWYDAASGGNLLLANSSTYSTSTAGTYYAESRNTTTGCISTTRKAIVLTINPIPVLSFSTSPATCILGTDGSVTLTVTGTTGPYTFAWSNGATTQNLTNVGQGTYTVTVTKVSTGCTETGSATVGHTCPKPTGLATTLITSTSATLSWNSTCAIYYRVRYKKTSVVTWTYLPTTTNTTQLITGLTTGITYEAQVENFCAATDSSGYTSSKTWTSATGTCQTPTSFSTTNITAHCATFNWTTPVDPLQWDLMWKSTNLGSQWADVNPQPLPYQRSYTLCGLDANQNYQWKIRAYCPPHSWQSFSNAQQFKTLAQRLDGDPLNEQTQSLNLYPNPNGGIFIIDLNTGTTSNATVDIQIMNMLGQVVYMERTTLTDGKLQKEVKLNNDFTAGTYFVKVLSGDQVFNGQIIYQK